MIVLQRCASDRQETPELRRPHVRPGATMMEYALMLSLIGVACLIGISYFGEETNNLTKNASTAISKSLSSAPGTAPISVGGLLPTGGIDDGEEKDGKKDKDDTTTK